MAYEEGYYPPGFSQYDDDEADIDCEVCSYRARYEIDMFWHLKDDHRHVKHKMQFYCKDCCDVWMSMMDFLTHRMVDHGDTSEQVFSEHFTRAAHLRAQGPTVCDFCDYRGRDASAVAVHRLEHHNHDVTTIRGKFCGHCDAYFAETADFERHVLDKHPPEPTPPSRTAPPSARPRIGTLKGPVLPLKHNKYTKNAWKLM